MPQNDHQADYGRRRTEENQKRTAKRREVLGRVESLLADNDIALEDVGSIEKIRVNEWEVVTKNELGKPEKTRARASSIVINPIWEQGPKWQPVQPADHVTIEVPRYDGWGYLKGWESALIEPDPQFGFLRDTAGNLHPTHDPQAIDVVEQVMEAERPEGWVNLGDYLDLAELSRFQQGPELVGTIQPAVQAGYEHAAHQAALAKAWKYIHEGNHDLRFQDFMINNARAAYGLRRAIKTPSDWPELSVPSLLCLDELGIDYVDGYPATWRYITDQLATTHGYGKSGSLELTKWYAYNEQVSVIHGHTHHAATVYNTRNTKTQKVDILAHSPGTLARVDGFTPGTGRHSGRKVKTGLPQRSWNDWQQGFTMVRYCPSTGAFEIEPVRISEGQCRHRGQEFNSRVELV